MKTIFSTGPIPGKQKNTCNPKYSTTPTIRISLKKYAIPKRWTWSSPWSRTPTESSTSTFSASNSSSNSLLLWMRSSCSCWTSKFQNNWAKYSSIKKIAILTSDRSFFFFENNMTTKIIKQFKNDVL